MRLVLIDDDIIDERFSREYRALYYMDRTIEDCNNRKRGNKYGNI